jgi:hypothetical protein
MSGAADDIFKRIDGLVVHYFADDVLNRSTG